MYILMNKDTLVLAFELEKGPLESQAIELKRYGAPIPVGMGSIGEWLENRKASKHNAHLRRLMDELGCSKTEGFIRITHAASVTDSFWVKNSSENISWKDVSLYDNEFNESISRLAFEGAGIPDEAFSTTSPELTTDGSFRKAFIRKKDGIYLYKRGSEGAMNSGLEPYCEAMGGELAELICSRAVHYDLVTLHGSLASRCRLFTNARLGYVPYSRYVTLNRKTSPNDMLAFFRNISEESGERFQEMLVLDAVTFNTDRHLGNFGVMVINDTQKILTMAPVFDMNLSLLPYVTEDEFKEIGEKLLDYTPSIGNDFTQIGQAAVTDSIRDRLKSLEGFTFTFRGDDFFQPWRVHRLEEMVNREIDALLSPEKLQTKDVFIPEHQKERAAAQRRHASAEKEMSIFYDRVINYRGINVSILQDSENCILFIEPEMPFDTHEFEVRVDFDKETATGFVDGRPADDNDLERMSEKYLYFLNAVRALQDGYKPKEINPDLDDEFE